MSDPLPRPRLMVDADACPVKPLLVRAAARHGLELVLVTATPMRPVEGPGVRTERVPGGPDAVDDWIIAHCEARDIVVTQDIPLAAAVIARGARVIENRGELLDAGNIGPRLATRDLLMSLRDQGAPLGGPRPYTEQDRRRFAQTLGRLLDGARRR